MLAGLQPKGFRGQPASAAAAAGDQSALSLRNDPHVRGIVVLGLDAPLDQLAASFAVAARQDLVKGFAVGRTIFAEAAREWLGGRMSDAAAVADMVAKYQQLCGVWDAARASKELAA